MHPLQLGGGSPLCTFIFQCKDPIPYGPSSSLCPIAGIILPQPFPTLYDPIVIYEYSQCSVHMHMPQCLQQRHGLCIAVILFPVQPTPHFQHALPCCRLNCSSWLPQPLSSGVWANSCSPSCNRLVAWIQTPIRVGYCHVRHHPF